MKSKIGTALMAFGSVLVASALGLFLYNTWLQHRAAEAVDALMPQLVDTIVERAEEPSAPDDPLLPKEMPVVEMDGYGYIGFVSVPTLGLELPVMADWSYAQLEIAPCRFSGDVYQDDLVIMAHNYIGHFAGLKDLRAGDPVTFTDMNGVTTAFTVTAVDVLAPTDVEEMTAGEYDLTLFTCTYGGQSRVTVRCDRTE